MDLQIPEDSSFFKEIQPTDEIYTKHPLETSQKVFHIKL